jgi:uncharacterized protein (DUF3820 family)
MSQGITPNALVVRKIFTSHIAMIASLAWSLCDFVFAQICGNPINTQSVVMNPENYILWFTAGVDWFTRHRQGTTDPTKTRSIFTTHIAISGSVVWSAASVVVGQICGHSIDLQTTVMNPENYIMWFAALVDYIQRHRTK